MAVTNTSARCNTIVLKNNICSTKCNTLVVTILLLWSYPGNGAKGDIMAGNDTLLWPWLRDYHIYFLEFCLLIHSMPISGN